MNQEHSAQSQNDNVDLRDLTPDEVLATAGGPQVINDQPALIDQGDLSGISGGPQVINDWPT